MKNLIIKIMAALILLMILCIITIHKQNNTLENVGYITIYDLSYDEGVKHNLSDFTQRSSYKIDNPKITYIDDLVLWKGDKFGILHLKDGKVVTIRVSVYGDFFSIVGRKGFYEYEKKN